MGGGGAGVQGWGGGRSGRVVLIDNGRVYQSKAADALVQVKTTTFGTNVGLNMLLNISSRYFGGLFWSRQLRGLPSSDGYFFTLPLNYFHDVSANHSGKIKPFLSFLSKQLTHWVRDKMDAISQTIFSSVLSCMKMFEFRSKFLWRLFLRVHLTIFQHWFR